MSSTDDGRRTTDSAFAERLEQAKLDALKELAYGASHEINNPLANISARAQTLLRGEADPERRRALEAIRQQALRAHEMISDLMLFARPPRLEPTPVDVGAIVRQVVAELTDQCVGRQIEIVATAGESAVPAVHADAVQLAVAINAVATNAMEAVGREGRIEIRWSAADAPGLAVRIEIEDNGPGISAAARPHIFEPFYSGREAGRGLGFGLSKAWRIVQQHGGRMVVESEPGAGAKFTIFLPPAPPAG